jgi:predicted Fe-Mo cluster-binding NifX family protein
MKSKRTYAYNFGVFGNHNSRHNAENGQQKGFAPLRRIAAGKEINMKIAVACDGSNVSEHFGHCEGFKIYDAEGGRVTGSKFNPNPGHRPGFLPNFLSGLGADVIITGGIGGGAVDIFNEKNIEVVSGASGDVGKAVEDYLNGDLKSSGSVCHEHEFKDTCEGHKPRE